MHAHRAHREHGLGGVEQADAAPEAGERSQRAADVGIVQGMAAIVRAGVARARVARRLQPNARRRAANALRRAARPAHHGGMTSATPSFSAPPSPSRPARPPCARPPMPPRRRRPRRPTAQRRPTSTASCSCPTDYREWIYVTSGLDMSYSRRPARPPHVRQRVREPGGLAGLQAHRHVAGQDDDGARDPRRPHQGLDQQARLLPGRRPDGRGGARQGHRALRRRLGLLHVRGHRQAGREIPRDVDCYCCHRRTRAVDTTFVQFYPTMLAIAKAKGTFAAAYLDAEKKGQ